MQNHRAHARRALFVIGALGVPLVPVVAQYAPYTPAPIVVEADPGASLATAMHILATQPKDLGALLAAGRASIALGDMQAAAGFFGRAEEYWPTSPAAKVGVGAAMTMMGDAKGAMALFDKAQSLGASQSMLALDRGLAFDLLGQQSRAQADYRVALSGAQGDEARRRLALSLAISKDVRGAAAMLEPLLARRDPAAVRTNAFVLALAGDREGARRTIDAALPGAGARFEPFFRLLPVLRPEEKAAAVHLGEFPKDAAQRYAQAEPIASSPVLTISNRPEVQIEPPLAIKQIRLSPPKSGKIKPERPVEIASNEAPRRAVRQAPIGSTYFAMSRPSLDPSQYVSQRRKAVTAAVIPKAPVTEAEPDPRPGFRTDDLAPVADATEPLVPINTGPPLNRDGEPLVSNDVALNTPSPISTPKLEIKRPPAPKPKIEKAKSKKVEPKKIEAPKVKEPASLLYVQLASGAHAERMGIEFERIKAKKPSLFAGHPARVTNGKDLFRLVIGPFKTRDDSNAFVSKLSKAGIGGFNYTAPDGMTFEKLPAK